LNESDVEKLIKEELDKYYITKPRGVNIPERIMFKIHAYISEEKYYRRSRIISKILIYRAFGILSGFGIGYLFTGSLEIASVLTVTIECIHTIGHYILERFYN